MPNEAAAILPYILGLMAKNNSQVFFNHNLTFDNDNTYTSLSVGYCL